MKLFKLVSLAFGLLLAVPALVSGANIAATKAGFVKALDGSVVICRDNVDIRRGKYGYRFLRSDFQDNGDGTAKVDFVLWSGLCHEGTWRRNNIWDSYTYYMPNTRTETPDDEISIQVDKSEMRIAAVASSNGFQLLDEGEVSQDAQNSGSVAFNLVDVVSEEQMEVINAGGEVRVQVGMFLRGFYSYTVNPGNDFQKQDSGGMFYLLLNVRRTNLGVLQATVK